MTPITTLVAAALVVGALTSAPAERTPPQSPTERTFDSLTNFKAQYANIKNLLIKLAEAMPEDSYAFQPVPAVQTFAGRIGHIAASNLSQCGGFLSKRHPLLGQRLEETVLAKSDGVEALKASFAFCDEFFATIDKRGNLMDKSYTLNTRDRDGQPLRVKMGYAGAIASLLGHNQEMYGYLSMYLRLKGITPPSSSR